MRMSHRLTLLFLLLLAPLAPAQVDSGSDTSRQPRAEDLREILSARAYGMGGAWRALGVGAESGTGNPAALAAFRTYRVELTGAWDWVGKDAFGMVALADSSTSALAAGVSYQLVSLGKGVERATGHLNTVGLAIPFGDSLMVGVSSRYLLLRGARQANAITGDAGILFRPAPVIALGVSAHNLIGTGNAELTRYYSAHAGVFAGLLTLAADVRADFETNSRTTLTYSGGLEYLLGQSFPLRAGYTWDGFTRSSQLSAGIGVMTPGGGIDIAYRHDLGGENGRLVALTLKVQVQ
jgi:opacity protein-like surface antigen